MQSSEPTPKMMKPDASPPLTNHHMLQKKFQISKELRQEGCLLNRKHKSSPNNSLRRLTPIAGDFQGSCLLPGRSQATYRDQLLVRPPPHNKFHSPSNPRRPSKLPGKSRRPRLRSLAVPPNPNVSPSVQILLVVQVTVIVNQHQTNKDL